MSHDALIVFEENNYEDLCEKFISKNQSAWDDFVYEEYVDRLMPEPPDIMEEI